MSDNILTTIRQEVSSHAISLDGHHVETITKAIYNQLIEDVSIEDLNIIIDRMKDVFVDIVDNLIPIIEEYEGKIDEVLEKHIGNISNRL